MLVPSNLAKSQRNQPLKCVKKNARYHDNQRLSIFIFDYLLGFPRDGTSRCPFVPGQKIFLSQCPFVPGQNPLSRDVPGQNGLKNFKQDDQIFCFRTSFSCFRTSFSCFRTPFSCFRASFSVLEHGFPVLERPFLLCPVLSRVPSRILAVPARPVPSLCKIFSLSRCPFVPGQGRNFCPFVPKSCAVPSRWKPQFQVHDSLTACNYFEIWI